jgi:hypothetical protein
MTKTLNKKNYFFIFAFTTTKVLLVLGALAIAIKPKLIENLYVKTIFCLLVLGIGIALIAMKRLHKADCFSVISHYYMRKTPCTDQDCLLSHKKNHKNIFLSIIQDLIGLTFAIASFLLVYNVFFHKIPNEKLLFFSRIYCSVFALSILASCAIALIVNLIGYHYCKYKLTHGSLEDKTEFKESVLSKTNFFINFLNFFHSIANILLSMHFYACHLFVTRDHFTAHFIAPDNGVRNKKTQDLLISDEKTDAINVIKAANNICDECDCKNFLDRTNKYHVKTNLNEFHVTRSASDAQEIENIYAIRANEFVDSDKIGIKFNFIGVEIYSLRFKDFAI